MTRFISDTFIPVSSENDNSGQFLHEVFIGQSPVMQDVYELIRNAAPSDASVFITGESGTGKELCAQCIHKLSKRSKAPLISLNCSAIPAGLMESEVFGHVRGAFTGAVSQRDGAAIMADGGTLFLDEICEMDLNLQAKLLRFIQTGTVNRVGSSTPRKVDVRFICATNRDPMEAVHAGRFREDLYYRLHVIPIVLPPLSARGEDILLIAETFLHRISRAEGKNFAGFSDETQELICQYTWPGNVRELENVIRNTVVMNSGETVEKHMLPAAVAHPDRQERPLAAPENSRKTVSIAGNGISPVPTPYIHDKATILPLWEEEKRIIERAIHLCDGNVIEAAAKLGINPSTIYRKTASWRKKTAS